MLKICESVVQCLALLDYIYKITNSIPTERFPISISEQEYYNKQVA
ncbi:20311_t:CDS:2 [Cetraspora pellucida]|uniref:20311_t:CDS:1 n=1 Tax=Cetraspora pellucida TaxID=1433469 RepID=A0A9N9CCS0_9GLOM|nr:20311_t:CDS:2 [Cetraspora pellucida]